MTADADDKHLPAPHKLSLLQAQKAAAYKGDGGWGLTIDSLQFVGSSSSSSGHGSAKEKALEAVNAPGYFSQGSVPSLADFGADRTYLTINAAELCSTLLVDDRRGRPEANHLVLLMVHGGYATNTPYHYTVRTLHSVIYINHPTLSLVLFST